MSSASIRSGSSARDSRGHGRAPPGRRTRRVEARRRDAAAARGRDARGGGGAQTFAADARRRACGSATRSSSPRTGPAERWPTPARRSACPSTTSAPRARSAPVPRRRGRPRAARAGAPVPPDVVQINSSKAGILARLALAGIGAPRRCSPPTAGRSRAAAAPQAPPTRRPNARSSRSATRSSASRITTCVLARERGIAPRGGVHVIHNGVDAPPRSGAPPPGRAARARLHRTAGAAQGPDHAARRARAAALRALGTARLR